MTRKVFKNRYRIVTDKYLGYEVQIRKWWWPFWIGLSEPGGPLNTWASIRHARLYALRHAFKGKVVENLEQLEEED